METFSHMQSFAVVMNAGSGPDGRAAKEARVRAAAATHGIDPPLFFAHDADTLRAAARKALNLGHPVIAAAGGDGTVSLLADEVIRGGATLAVLPMGTLNHFARDLGIPLGPEDAFRTILDGRTLHVDVGRVNDRLFLNTSSLGLYPNIVEHREEAEARVLPRWLAFGKGVWEAVRRHTFLEVTMSLGGEERVFRTPFIFVGNNRHSLEGFDIGKRDRLDEGVLSVSVSRHATRARLLALAWHALIGDLTAQHDFHVFETDRVTIGSRRTSLALSLDGEIVRMAPPLRYEILSKALRVIVPGAYP